MAHQKAELAAGVGASKWGRVSKRRVSSRENRQSSEIVEHLGEGEIREAGEGGKRGEGKLSTRGK